MPDPAKASHRLLYQKQDFLPIDRRGDTVIPSSFTLQKTLRLLWFERHPCLGKGLVQPSQEPAAVSSCLQECGAIVHIFSNGRQALS